MTADLLIQATQLVTNSNNEVALDCYSYEAVYSSEQYIHVYFSEEHAASLYNL